MHSYKSLFLDPRLHPAFRQYGGMELVLGMLHDAVAKPRGREQVNRKANFH